MKAVAARHPFLQPVWKIYTDAGHSDLSKTVRSGKQLPDEQPLAGNDQQEGPALPVIPKDVFLHNPSGHKRLVINRPTE